jgi:lipoprotein-anchoring transpeptidase ErfK/SrfK
VRPGRTVELHAKPGGKVLASVGGTTQFGSPTTLTVAAQKAGWLGVTSTDLPNGRLGWVKAKKSVLDQRRTHLAIRIDLSSRKLRLMDGRRVLRTATVGIGRPGSPTPAGRYAITDKLSGGAYGPFYGCCILALSGHQTNTPAGWKGGDRLAIHGTNDPSSIGAPSSAGCLHADAEDLKVLMRRVPLGTPVFIKA